MWGKIRKIMNSILKLQCVTKRLWWMKAFPSVVGERGLLLSISGYLRCRTNQENLTLRFITPGQIWMSHVAKDMYNHWYSIGEGAKGLGTNQSCHLQWENGLREDYFLERTDGLGAAGDLDARQRCSGLPL